MLVNLTINNFLLIKNASVDFGNSLCVLTGETGAGKSILLDCLKFVLGKKSSKELLRKDEKQAVVCAEFVIDINIKNILSENSIEYSDSLIIRRVLYKDGRTKSFINDIPISLPILKKISEKLIEFHGQHDQHNLLDSNFHRILIDEYGEFSDRLIEIKNQYQVFKESELKLKQTNIDIEKVQAERNYLEHIVNELNELSPIEGEENELVNKRAILSNKEKLTNSLQSALNELNSTNVITSIKNAENHLIKIPEDTAQELKLNEPLNSLESASIEINEAISLIENSLQMMDDTSDLESIEDRLFSLRDAARKFRCQPDELEKFLDKSKEKLQFIEHSSESIDILEQKVVELKNNYLIIARELSKARKEIATKLEIKLCQELEPLKMEKTKFEVEFIEHNEDNWSVSGIDKITFLASSNPGSPIKPIGKIASGGELSRFMLALKVVLSNVKQTPVMIFDEIDTGVSGAVSEAIGKRLFKLGKLAQILVVTHQPQIAAKGNHHYLIEKQQGENSTNTSIQKIEGEIRNEEIARMIAGEKITNEAKAAARKLFTEIV